MVVGYDLGGGTFNASVISMAARRHEVVHSAGILLHRPAAGGWEVLLGHMGGPFWARKDAGAWSLIKGEYEPDEAPQDAARREFTEELGLPAPTGEYLPLGEIRQSSGKVGLAPCSIPRSEQDFSAK